MTSFTNTKWTLLPPSVGVDYNWHITDDGDTCVLHAYGFNHAVDDDSKALAERAIACLTACVGIPTARLEAGASGILTYSMELKKQRDELLSAAKFVVSRWDTPNWKDAEPTSAVIGKLRNAIANAEENHFPDVAKMVPGGSL